MITKERYEQLVNKRGTTKKEQGEMWIYALHHFPIALDRVRHKYRMPNCTLEEAIKFFGDGMKDS